ncbi:MAG: hypothetical protein ACE5H4_07460 [Candidatus Thorarchaeota archaeon]
MRAQEADATATEARYSKNLSIMRSLLDLYRGMILEINNRSVTMSDNAKPTGIRSTPGLIPIEKSCTPLRITVRIPDMIGISKETAAAIRVQEGISV